MSLVIYTLNKDGSIPSYILDGGYLAIPNENPSPQDLDLVGLTNEDVPNRKLNSRADLENYIQEKSIKFFNPQTKQEISGESYINALATLLG